MLAQKNRLTRREDFLRVCTKGNFLSLNGLALRYFPSLDSKTQIGFSVGLKFSKKAVERNRLKRLLRNAVRIHIESLKPGFDIVVIGNAVPKKYDLKTIADVLENLFKKAKLIK
ncbi:MAG TPA: ribonuclease P protein component [Candidatus Moranbacteria bacterium]|nr:ribonuclease P protein component [Candidatus Moranbacteria bacterium]